MYELGRAAAHGSSANLKKWIMIQKDFQLIASVLPREREHAQTPDANVAIHECRLRVHQRHLRTPGAGEPPAKISSCGSA